MGNNNERGEKIMKSYPVDDVFVFSCGSGAEKKTHKEAEK